MPPHPASHSLPPEARGARLLTAGTAVGVAGAAALACTLPAALRIAPAFAAGGGLPRVWVALGAAALGPMALGVFALRGAREGLRAYSAPLPDLRMLGVGLWLASLFVAFALIGAVLRATTHQHSLAGVTFAFLAAAVAVASALLWGRLIAIIASAGPGLRAVLAMAAVLGVAGPLAWVGLQFVRAVSRDAASAASAATVIDVLAFALAALFAARPSLTRSRALALLGPPVAVLIAALGVSSLRSAPLVLSIEERAPVFAPSAALLH